MITNYQQAKQYAYRLRTQTLEEDVELIKELKENSLLALIDFHVKYGHEVEVSHFKIEDDFGMVRIENQERIFPEDVETLVENINWIQREVQTYMSRTNQVDETMYQSFCCRYLMDHKLGLTQLDYHDYMEILIEDYVVNQADLQLLTTDEALDQEWQQFVGDEEDLVFN